MRLNFITSLFTCFIRFASKSLMFLCLIITNPPRLQFCAWWPQGYWEESLSSSLAYRSLWVFLNSPLFRRNQILLVAARRYNFLSHFWNYRVTVSKPKHYPQYSPMKPLSYLKQFDFCFGNHINLAGQNGSLSGNTKRNIPVKT